MINDFLAVLVLIRSIIRTGSKLIIKLVFKALLKLISRSIKVVFGVD